MEAHAGRYPKISIAARASFGGQSRAVSGLRIDADSGEDFDVDSGQAAIMLGAKLSVAGQPMVAAQRVKIFFGKRILRRRAWCAR